MQIGERILFYRKRCNLTQEDVAVALNTTPQNIYKYEKGIIKNIPLSSIIAMADVFGVSPAELAGIDLPYDKSDYLATLPEKLRNKRKTLSISAHELAVNLRILPLFIEDFESGVFEALDARKLKKLTAFLDGAFDHLFEPSDNGKPEFYYPKFTSSDFESLSHRSRIAQTFISDYDPQIKKD